MKYRTDSKPVGKGPCATATELAAMCDGKTAPVLARLMNQDPDGPRPVIRKDSGVHLSRHSWYSKAEAVRWLRAQGLLKAKESK